jgi:NAD(P)-dependent dehydrogenase (short-subunit alcohol dehydrogenase family)
VSWSIGAGLEHKGVLVTGAAGGIGREVARAFAAAGAHVLAADVRADAVHDVAASLDGDSHLAVGIDLRDLSGHQSLMRAGMERFGRLDVLAHAAAVLIRRYNVNDVTEEDWDIQHDVNLKATFFLNRAAAELFRAQGRGGRIINFTSQAWWTGGFGGAVAYAATKGGVVSLTRGLARIYAKDRITVNAVAPGAADTPMLRSGVTDEQIAAHMTQIPLGYLAAPSDLAGIVVFLASDHARYITGATINVSGGWLMY